MRRIASQLVTLGVIFAVISGCQGEQRDSPAALILQGEHQLRKVVERVESKSSFSGGFFLFVGIMEGNTESYSKVRFAWQMNDGTYALSSLPMDRVRVKIDNSVATPTIKFRWVKTQITRIDTLMAYYVTYALVTCKDSDWPVNIRMPLNETK